MECSEIIGTYIYRLLKESNISNDITGSIGWQRNDYSKEDIIIVPCSITGEGSVQYGQINVNIHVPDKVEKSITGDSCYKIDFQKLVTLRSSCIKLLQGHFVPDSGISWTIGQLNPPIKEQDQNEHFVSIAIEVTVRNKN